MNTWLKRFIRPLPLVLTVAPLLCLGCTKSEDESGAIRLVVLDTATRPGEKAVWDKAIKQFEAQNPGVKVDLRNAKADDYPKLHLPQALGSRRPPDAYFNWAGYVVKHHAEGNIARDISHYFQDPAVKNRFDSRCFIGTMVDGKHYMLPVSMSAACLMWYQKSILARHNIAPPKTWDELIAACKKLKAGGITPIVNGNLAGWPIGNWAAQMAAAYMGRDDYYRAGLDKPTVSLDDPRIVKAVQRIQELVKINAFNKDINTLDGDEGLALFLAKRGAFHMVGEWVVDSVTPEEVGVVPLPRLPDALPAATPLLANSVGFLFHKRSKHPELTLKLLDIYVSAPVQTLAAEYGRITAVTESHKYLTGPLRKQFVEIFNQANTWIGAPDISWKPAIAEAYMTAVKSVINAGATPEQALQSAARSVAAMTR